MPKRTKPIEPITNRPVRAVSVREAADRLSCSVRMIYLLIGSGSLASFTLGRARRIREDELERFIADSEMDLTGRAA